MRAATHRASVTQVSSLYLGRSDPPRDAAGPALGLDEASGALFCFDPFAAYAAGGLTCPNLLVLGQVGSGKSSLAKVLAWTQSGLLGHWVGVIDPKGEYQPLAGALGLDHLALGSPGSARLNPLATDPGLPPAQAGAQRGEVTSSLASALADRGLAPEERAAIAALARTENTLAGVVSGLMDPSGGLAAGLATTPAALAREVRPVALELARLVDGDLAGLFSDEPSDQLDSTRRGLVVELSALYSKADLLAPAMVAVGAALSAALADPSTRHVLIIDEAWSVLANAGVARWLRATMKLARALGAAVVLVSHSLGDFDSVGQAGSEAARTAAGLVADVGAWALLAQSDAALPGVRKVLGLTPTESGRVSRLSRGQALWRIGSTPPALVRLCVPPGLEALVDTDARMVGP